MTDYVAKVGLFSCNFFKIINLKIESKAKTFGSLSVKS